MMAPVKLDRETFTTSRLMEFFRPEELAMQIGHHQSFWPGALLKELVDNALDACETAGAAPRVTVTLAEDVLEVRDNGPGIPPDVVRRSLDYSVRVSSKPALRQPDPRATGQRAQVCLGRPVRRGRRTRA